MLEHDLANDSEPDLDLLRLNWECSTWRRERLGIIRLVGIKLGVRTGGYATLDLSPGFATDRDEQMKEKKKARNVF